MKVKDFIKAQQRWGKVPDLSVTLPAELCAVSAESIKHRRRETPWQQTRWLGMVRALGGKKMRQKEGSQSGNATPNLILTPINQCCREASMLLCCPLPHSSSIWIRSEISPREHASARATLSGSQGAEGRWFPPKNILNTSSEGWLCEPSGESIVGI